MAVTGAALALTGVRNLMRGYPFRRGLPYGYWTSAIGVVVFLLGGLFDLWWHTIYGIEVSIQGLVSPSHLILALGGALVLAGVYRSIARQYGEDEGRWRAIGPALLAGAGTLMLLGFFTQYAAPFADDTMLAILRRVPPATGGALYSVRADGSRQTRISSASGHDMYGVTLSPDGRHIAYRLQATGGSTLPSDIYVANADGSNARRITHSGRHDTQPAWSPDGQRIAFISVPAGTSGEFALRTVRFDGSDVRTVAHGVTRMLVPAWSPDSKAIAVGSRNGVTAEIAIVPLAGGALHWLASTAGGSDPAWSKDGRIAFDTQDGDVAVTLPGGNGSRVLVANASSPSWSPDGAQLAYLQSGGGQTQVFLANANGAHARDVSGLAGLDATSASISRAGTVFFTAAGATGMFQTGLAQSYGMDSAIISTIVLMGIVLFLVRRWRVPLGGITVLTGVFALAMVTQSDLYFLLPAAIGAALLADLYLAVLGDRARTGLPFYVLGAGMPLLLFALYEVSVAAHLGALGWPPNLLLGAPIVAGFAGLLVAFCYRTPLTASALSGAESR